MPSSLTDEDVMFQVREGAGEMLGILFDRYHAKLLNYYVRLTGDRALSEDLVQEVFYRILRSRRTYRPGNPFRPWIYQVARNARIDHFRRPAEVAFEEGMPEPVVAADDFSDREQNELLQRALLELPDDKRDVLVLSRYQGLTYSEIAQLHGCDEGTIKTRAFRAIRELRDIIAKWDARSRPRTRNAYEM
jgi:RNA polymerase sigma-70 factor (ECF subfamily)